MEKPFDLLLVIKSGDKMIHVNKGLDVSKLEIKDLEGLKVVYTIDLDLLVQEPAAVDSGAV